MAGHARFGGALQSIGMGLIAKNSADARHVGLVGKVVQQRLQVAAGAGDQYDNGFGAHAQCCLRLFRTMAGAPASAALIWPITQGCSPLARRCSSTRCWSFAATQMIMPTPQLSTRCISVSSTLPFSCSQSKIAGRCQL